MNEVVITWCMLLPEMFFERVLVVIGGAGMFIHFLCMTSAAPKAKPIVFSIFQIWLAFSLVGMAASAVSGNIDSMWKLLMSSFAAIVFFYLWLWANGMHVKDFLVQKYGA